jgi:hypothetical protein
MEIVDYAYPCMMAEKALKELHDKMLDRDYDTALDLAMKALVEVKMTYNSIKHMKEVENERHTDMGSYT